MDTVKRRFCAYPISQLDTVVLTWIKNSNLHCGFPSPAGDYEQHRVNLTRELIKNPDYTELVEVHGDSMKDRFIPDPCLVLIDYTLTPVEGDIVYVRFDNGDLLREYRKAGAEVFLHPRNRHRQYPVIKASEHADLEIRGVVIQILVNPRPTKRR